MKCLTILFLTIFSITSCCKSKEPFSCNCDNKYLAYNDSILREVVADTASFNHMHRVFSLPKITRNETETYRLKMMHSFSRYAQFYTLSRKKIGATLEIIQFYDDRNRKTTINVDKKYTVPLSEDQWLAIKKTINTSCYWSNEARSGYHDGLDGGSWLLEGYDPDQRNCPNRMYHIDICSYDESNKLGDLCRSIRKYAKEEKLNVYSDEQ